MAPWDKIRTASHKARWDRPKVAMAWPYYSVGYVTCLEWHARSRLVDLLTYLPGAAKPDDVKQLRDSVVIEMLSADVTVAGMIGASTNVSSLDA